ncbi:hypothetical protein T440DRAFT_469638 [Plenodomus tracheiphilus IPT5]|uniref:Uncharacterized protein n=1 Tax=Plenodomus tracheiphilus IPT5 TaxID=1408161 RepID=A0A6A7B246_9PLEO|nr:hypothetical protein T440DRAFT_469638 [Plenodomus tracheiphilus IPT5]
METLSQTAEHGEPFTDSVLETAHTQTSTWSPRFSLPSMDSATLITVLAAVLPLLLLWAYRRYEYAHRQPFRFLDLPQELRDMVYENLIEDPFYPPPKPCQNHCKTLWLLPGCTASAPTYRGRLHGKNWIFLVSKQLYREYMDMICKRTTFHLTVSPQNYQFSPDTPATSPPDGRIWNIGKDTLQNLKTCSLKLITTSAMLGVTDPRNMTSSDWTLARQIREELKDFENVTNLTLDAKALGDPLWNPLWIWYHSSQSFKAMGTELSDTTPKGPKLTRITFSLDTWSPGENYLERDEKNEGRWTWYCMQGHEVGLDIGPHMTVREFCAQLYRECGICRESGEDAGQD